ncbi:MAG: DnaD domain protein [Christensenellaceae bacterium]|nr:DnaD domain protein [Christensenellaceae bacterium]
MYDFVAFGEGTVSVLKSFITDLLPNADEKSVKIYLYALYLASEKRNADADQIGEALGIGAEDVKKGIAFLEKKGYIKKDGISYIFCLPENQERYSESIYSERAYLSTISDIMGGRQFSPGETETLIDLKRVYRLPEDVVFMMVEHVSSPSVKGRRVSVKYLEKTALAWAEENVSTKEDAQTKIDRYTAVTSGARKVINKLYGGNTRLPNAAEKELYEKWTKEWGFTEDAVVTAVADASLVQEPSMKYLDAVLKRYMESGVLTSAAIVEMRELRNREKENLKEVLSALKQNRRSITSVLQSAYRDWRELGFSHESVIKACEYTVKSGFHSYKKVDELLRYCAEKGIVSDEAVAEKLSFQTKEDVNIRQVIAAMGITSEITAFDRKLYNHAVADLEMTHEMIMLAADMSSMKKEPRSYMAKLLEIWSERGIDTPAKAKRSGRKVAEYMQRDTAPNSGFGMDYIKGDD